MWKYQNKDAMQKCQKYFTVRYRATAKHKNITGRHLVTVDVLHSLTMQYCMLQERKVDNYKVVSRHREQTSSMFVIWTSALLDNYVQ